MLDIRKKIGIIGFGNMGSIIAHKLVAQSNEYAIWVFEKDQNKAVKIKGINFSKDIPELVSIVDTFVLAVKPQDLDKVLKDLKKYSAGKLIISIAAGISTKHIETILPNARVVRVMPNIAARIGESVTCLCKGSFALDDDLDLVHEIFSYLGVARIIDENMMNAATAISGSGPGYIFYFIENSDMEPENISEHARHDMMRRLEKAAEAVGFNIEDAAFLAANTVNASINLLKATRLTPKELKTQVASKGGTTEAGLEVLHKGGSWEDAALAALKRASDLARRS
jgi:pyrroline-5-carboxylate reductase